MPYKKINNYNSGINAELDIAAREQEDRPMGYCENCGALLVHKEGKIMRFDDGSWQRLFCGSCYDLQTERQYSHV